MIKVLFFAQVRELTGTSSLEVGADYPDVAALRSALAERDDRWALALESGTVSYTHLTLPTTPYV